MVVSRVRLSVWNLLRKYSSIVRGIAEVRVKAFVTLFSVLSRKRGYREETAAPINARNPPRGEHRKET